MDEGHSAEKRGPKPGRGQAAWVMDCYGRRPVDMVREFGRQRDIMRAALDAIVNYAPVNEMTTAPALPVAPLRMQDIARAALVLAFGQGTRSDNEEAKLNESAKSRP